VEHIADVADVGKGTIYNYFATKEDIVVAFMADLKGQNPGQTSSFFHLQRISRLPSRAWRIRVCR
jgi:AcrR family transcriptional regulator